MITRARRRRVFLFLITSVVVVVIVVAGCLQFPEMMFAVALIVECL